MVSGHLPSVLPADPDTLAEIFASRRSPWLISQSSYTLFGKEGEEPPKQRQACNAECRKQLL